MTDVSSHIESITLHLQNLGAPLLVLLIAAAIAASVWYYRTTHPAPEGLMRPVLVTLRASALALLLIGLAEPVLTLVRSLTQRDTVAVLLDTSISMNNVSDNSTAPALDAAASIESSLGDGVRIYGFDTGVREIDSQPSFDGPATDITGAIEAVLRNRDVSSVVLISDGRWNLGENPAGSALPRDVPVYTVFTPGREVRDAAIRSVSAANIGHAGDSLMVEIEITAGGQRDPIPVMISEEGAILSTVTVHLDSVSAARVRLPLSLDSPGDHRYIASIAPEGDSRTENNSREFGVQVLKSSFTVLLSAPLPSADLAFIRRAIESDGAFALVLDVNLPGGGSTVAVAIDSLDAVIVLDGGGPYLHNNADVIAGRVRDGAGIWFAGSAPPGPELAPLTGAMPFAFTDSIAEPETGVLLQLKEMGQGHFITSGEQGGLDAEDWPALPPLTSILRVTAEEPEVQVLAVTLPAGENDAVLPAVVTGMAGNGRVLAIPCSGLWRWQLRMAGADRSDTMFDAFVTGCIRWLTASPETDPLRVTTGSAVYPGGAEIDFEGRLYDHVFSPLPGAEIDVTVDDNPAWRLFLGETTPGLYTGMLRGIPSGEHSFRAAAYLDNRMIAEYEGSFTVADFSLDMLDASADPGVMRAIAERTGGISVTPSGIDSVLIAAVPSFTSERRESVHHPYLHPAFPLIAIMLLVIEWGIRKRRGMI